MARKCNKNEKIGKYIVDYVVFEGGRCINYKANFNSGKPVFIKQYKNPVPRYWNYYCDFINYQSKLKERLDKPIIKEITCECYDFFEFDPTNSGDPKRKNYFQAFEFITEGENLSSYLASESTTWAQRLTFAKILMFSISKFHQEKIVHCDLKPENIYLVQDSTIRAGYRLKLIDFDYTFLKDLTPPWIGVEDEGFGGTPGYLSPEHIKVSEGVYPSTESDVFTCGIILYELLMQEGHPYFVEGTLSEEYNNQIFEYNVKKPHLLESTGDADVDKEICNIVYECLNPIANKRPTAKAVHDVLIKARTVKTKEIKLPLPIKQVFNNEKSDVLVLESKCGSFKTKIKLAHFGYGNEQRLFPNEDIYYSKIQFDIVHEEDGWYILPLSNTKNCTIINGVNVASKIKISNGDIISVGNATKKYIKHPLTVKLG